MNKTKQLSASLVIVCLILTFGLTGCGTSSKERIENLQRVVSAAVTQVEALSADLENFQVIIKESNQTLAQSEIDKGIRDRIEKVLSKTLIEVDKAQAKKDQIVAQVKVWEQQIAQAQSDGDITIGGEMQVYGQGVKTLSVALPSPWNTLLNIAGGLLIAGGGVATRRLQKKVANTEQERDSSKRITKNIVDSVDVLLTEIDERGSPQTLNKMEAQKLLKQTQADETQAVVRTIKKKNITVAA